MNLDETGGNIAEADPTGANTTGAVASNATPSTPVVAAPTNPTPITSAVSTALGSGTINNTNDANDFTSQLQSALLNTSGMISSENNDINDTLNTAISGLQKSQNDSDQATTLDYNDQEAQASRTGVNNLTSAQESSRGFATNTALLGQIQDTTEKQINDLEEKKQQAILTGDAASAKAISDLQMTALTDRVNNTQKVFDNLISLGNYTNSTNTANSNIAKTSFDEQNAMATVALKYGLAVQPGDTLATLTARAMPFASKEEQQSLQLQAAQINEANANAQKALQGDASQGPTDPGTIAAMAASMAGTSQAAQSYATIVANKYPATYALIQQYLTKQAATPQVLSTATIAQYAPAYRQQYPSLQAAETAINADATIDPSSKPALIQALSALYSSNTAQGNNDLKNNVLSDSSLPSVPLSGPITPNLGPTLAGSL